MFDVFVGGLALGEEWWEILIGNNSNKNYNIY